MAIRFNRSQLKNPTPASVSFKINIVLAVCSAGAAWIGTAAFISASLSSILQSILSLIVLICVAVKPFFGVETTAANVPTEDVKEMEDK